MIIGELAGISAASEIGSLPMCSVRSCSGQRVETGAAASICGNKCIARFDFIPSVFQVASETATRSLIIWGWIATLVVQSCFYGDRGRTGVYKRDVFRWMIRSTSEKRSGRCCWDDLSPQLQQQTFVAFLVSVEEKKQDIIRN